MVTVLVMTKLDHDIHIIVTSNFVSVVTKLDHDSSDSDTCVSLSYTYPGGSVLLPGWLNLSGSSIELTSSSGSTVNSS